MAIDTRMNPSAPSTPAAPETDFSMEDVSRENTKQIQNIMLQAKLTEQRNLAETVGKTIKGGSEAVKGLA